LLFSVFPNLLFSEASGQTINFLDPTMIPKWVNTIDNPPPVYIPNNNVTDNSGSLIRQEYSIGVREFEQQLLPTLDLNGNPTGFRPSKVWGFSGQAKDAITGQPLGLVQSTPGCTFETTRGVPIQVKWINNLFDDSGDPLSHMFAVDPTLHWANPNKLAMHNSMTAPPFPSGYSQAQNPVPIVIHLHGGEVSPPSDGHPQAWWTANGLHGEAYNTVVPTEPNSAVFEYPNQQEASTLWYHDHALGITRLNVMSGLAGFYLLRNPDDELASILPSGQFEIPMVIQDRNFLSDGQLYYPSEGTVPTVHPYWNPTFQGNTLMVNGLVWPNIDVKQGQYRLRILDGSNTRFYTMRFSNNMAFTLIGSDGGYLKSPVTLTSLVISPGERVDILLDFSNIAPGEKIILQNSDPLLSESEKDTLGQILQFTILNDEGFSPKTLPMDLNPTLQGNYPTLPEPSNRRILTLIEQGFPPDTVAMLLDGQSWDSPVSEKPQLGTIEDWIIINPTMDSHPIHLHLVQFQLVERQTLSSKDYMTEWNALNRNLPLKQSTVNVQSFENYLIGQPIKPAKFEESWKDTIQADAGSVTVIRVRFATQDGSNYNFDPTIAPGYVWHCHILEHEDNEMMRPLVIFGSNDLLTSLLTFITIVVIVVLVFVITLIYYKQVRKKGLSVQV
jgi:spore coat protein A, manganese oxidase